MIAVLAKDVARWVGQLQRFALKRREALAQHLRHFEHQRQQHQIDAETAFSGGALKQVEIAGHRGAVLHGGDALGGVQPLGRLKLGQPLVFGRLRHVHEQGDEGRSHHQAGGLGAAGPAHDHPTGRIRGAGVVARQGKATAVEGTPEKPDRISTVPIMRLAADGGPPPVGFHGLRADLRQEENAPAALPR
ncbi:hypothetical protein H8F25_07310 [Synechococcus sp. CBW1004]|nr:hypothetical protein H8F25_07310 [Synechococcus sp. CBW1004]